MPKSNLRLFMVLIIFILLSIGIATLVGQLVPPTVYDAYPLTIEENDFAPANTGQTTFQTLAQTKSKFVIVFRNGTLQRPCNAAATAPCDYLKTGNVIVTYPAGTIQAGDQVTVFYFR